MDAPGILLDTDVIVNWLVQEVATASGRELWKAPLQIIKLAENKTVSAFISLTTLIQLRYLLRRKKSCDIRKIEEDLSALTSVIDVIIPDEIALLRANSLQADVDMRRPGAVDACFPRLQLPSTLQGTCACDDA